jgi:hypothetical protein
MAQAHNESETLLSSTDDFYIKEVRGKYVISSMPSTLVFGIPGTLLECQQCMDNASWRGVLLGACQECALQYTERDVGNGYVYDVGNGYGVKDPEAMPCDPRAKPFGFYRGFACDICIKIDRILKQVEDSRIPSEPRAIKHQDAYSFYGLASLEIDDFNLIYQGYSYDVFHERYNIECEGRHNAIVRAIDSLRDAFDPFSPEFYGKCEKMEKEWMMCPEATTQEEVFIAMGEEKEKEEKDKNVLEKQCHYCGDIKPLKKCGKCKCIRYCSVACRSRDWSKGGAYACQSGGMVSSPHKESCDYLLSLRLDQEQYEEEQRQEREAQTQAQQTQAQQTEEAQAQQTQAEQEDDWDAELDREAGRWWGYYTRD